jgi:sec-independent protein translocase protein TatA
MIGDLVDSPWKILIVAIVLIVLFGSKKLPHAAKSLGQSMRILKKEVRDMRDDDTVSGTPGASAAASAPAAAFPPPAEIAASQQPDQSQAQIDALQQQIRDLQRAATMEPAQVRTPAEAPVPQHTQQSS